jgi:hypothetical protein
MIAFLALASMPLASESSRVTIYPAPKGEPASEDYQVFVNGKQTFCYTSFRYDTTSKQTIVGRPVSPVSFCYFDHEGPVEVEVRFLDGLKKAGIDTSKATVRPLARSIRPQVKDGRIRFRIDRPGPITVEPGGSLTHPLHIFANPPEKDTPDKNDPNVLYYGPGIHEVREIDLKSGQTVYIAGGAVVYLKPIPNEKRENKHEAYGLDVYWAPPGLFTSTRQKNVTVRGRGILCGRRSLDHRQRGPLAKFEFVEDLTVEGIIIRESPVWSLNMVNCKNVRISNVKVIGHFVNNDGIVIGGTSDAVVEDCFSHNADDSLEIKVWIPQKNVTFRNCVVWNDIGGSFGLFHECGADLENVLFHNCTVLHSTDGSSVCPVVGIKLTGTGNVRNVRFEGITIEDVTSEKRPALKLINNWDDWHIDCPTKPDSPYELLNPPKREQPYGSIRDVLFKNIRVLECKNQDVALISDGEASPIEDITFDNVVIAGRRLVPDDPRIKKNQWVRNITVR